MLPSIVIIGRSNVGKSTIFNRLIRSSKSIVSNEPNLTRDLNYSSFFIDRKCFLLVDSGGIVEQSSSEVVSKTLSFTNLAIDEADLVLFVVDAKDGIQNPDESISKKLFKKKKKVFLLVNKSEGVSAEIVKSEFYKLGFKTIFAISAIRGVGLKNLKLEIYDSLKHIESNREENKKVISFCVVGKPNVGKSTLVNSILGEERMITLDQPGTTVDAVDTFYRFKNQSFSIIDTAGIRKKTKIDNKIEKFSVIKAMQSINLSNVVVIVLDANHSVSDQDIKIITYAINQGKGILLVVNKWDMINSYQKKLYKQSLNKKLFFLENIKKIYTSAKKYPNLTNVTNNIMKSYNSSSIKLKTSEINELIKLIIVKQKPPRIGRIRPKIKFGHQGGMNPPRIIFHGHNLNLLPKSYCKYLENSMIQHLNLYGTPLKISFRDEKK